ncbi:MAG TPA: GtrA family protein [Caulobacteraceae bacterium]|nr:GtrA family protein [Caulobacteraceae bacterium]
MGRLIRFGLTGVVTTGISYLVFVGLLRLGVNYLVACTISWAAALTVGFAINRRFTFGIVGGEKRRRDFGFYLAGAVCQLGLGLAGYRVLIGQWRLDPTLAFGLNLVLVTTFSFLFMRFVTFRRVATPANVVEP